MVKLVSVGAFTVTVPCFVEDPRVAVSVSRSSVATAWLVSVKALAVAPAATVIELG
jgi:hypothetical protein